jgi:UDP-glucose 4-epimerase
MATRSLLNTAVKCGVSRFIYSSTAAVYGNPDQLPGRFHLTAHRS